MRVVLDASALVAPRTGVGRYVEGLLGGLLALPTPPDLAVAAFTLRGDRPAVGAPWVGPRVPAGALHAFWRRGPLPTVEWLTGRADVFHATNYLLPPLRHAAGVVTVHDLSFLLHADTVSPGVLRYQREVPRALRRAAAVLTVSHSVRAEVIEHLDVPPDKVHAVHLGVAKEWFDTPAPDAGTRAPLGLAESYLLFVGSQEPRKGLTVLVDALAQLQDRGEDVPPLVLAGPAGWGPPVDDGRLADGSVRRLGWVDDAALRQVVAGAAALVLPSRYEGFGLPPLEAFACGTPVVVSDLPVLREVSGPLAVYARPGDPDALAEAVLAVLADDGGAVARAARRNRAATFTWQRCAEQTLAVYEQVG